MKLLLDQNLSRKLGHGIRHRCEQVTHVSEIGLSSASDQAIWDYAKLHEYTIVSKDSDFLHRATLFGAPPKVIWLRLGNAPHQASCNVYTRHGKKLNYLKKTIPRY